MMLTVSYSSMCIGFIDQGACLIQTIDPWVILFPLKFTLTRWTSFTRRSRNLRSCRIFSWISSWSINAVFFIWMCSFVLATVLHANNNFLDLFRVHLREWKENLEFLLVVFILGEILPYFEPWLIVLYQIQKASESQNSSSKSSNTYMSKSA